jgi:hypothetical protein
MPTLIATFIDGKIVPDVPPPWPDGLRLVVEAVPVPPTPVRMMTEEEQGDDAVSVARWVAAFDAIPVTASSPFDDPGAAAWRETMRRYNVGAVRGQMDEVPE